MFSLKKQILIRIVHTENMARNSNETFKQLHIKYEVVLLFDCREGGDRCPVHILEHTQWTSWRGLLYEQCCSKLHMMCTRE